MVKKAVHGKAGRGQVGSMRRLWLDCVNTKISRLEDEQLSTAVMKKINIPPDLSPEPQSVDQKGSLRTLGRVARC